MNHIFSIISNFKSLLRILQNLWELTISYSFLLCQFISRCLFKTFFYCYNCVRYISKQVRLEQVQTSFVHISSLLNTFIWTTKTCFSFQHSSSWCNIKCTFFEIIKCWKQGKWATEKLKYLVKLKMLIAFDLFIFQMLKRGKNNLFLI